MNKSDVFFAGLRPKIRLVQQGNEPEGPCGNMLRCRFFV